MKKQKPEKDQSRSIYGDQQKINEPFDQWEADNPPTMDDTQELQKSSDTLFAAPMRSLETTSPKSDKVAFQTPMRSLETTSPKSSKGLSIADLVKLVNEYDNEQESEPRPPEEPTIPETSSTKKKQKHEIDRELLSSVLGSSSDAPPRPIIAPIQGRQRLQRRAPLMRPEPPMQEPEPPIQEPRRRAPKQPAPPLHIPQPKTSRREKPGRPPAFPSGVDVVRLTVTVEKSTWKALRAYLTENETTQNETVNAALRQFLGLVPFIEPPIDEFPF